MSEPIVYQSLIGGTSFDGNAESYAPYFGAFAADAENAASSEMVFTSAASYSVLGPAALGAAVSEAQFYGFAFDAENVASSRMEFVGYARGIGLLPDIGAAVSTMSFTEITETFSVDFGAATSTMVFRAMASDEENVAMGYAPDFFATANDIPPPDLTGTSLLLFQTTGWMVLTAGYPTSSAYDEGLFYDYASATLTISAFDTGNARDTLGSQLRGLNTVYGDARAYDAALVILWLTAEAEAVAEDSAVASMQLLMEAADLALAIGFAGSKLTATALVAALAEASDSATLIRLLTASSAGEAFDDAAIERIGLILTALDSGEFTDEAATTLRIVVLGDDAGVASAEPGASLTGLAAAFDSGQAFGYARINGETYAIYAMTLQGAAVTEIAGVDIDSYFLVGNQMYAVGEHGIFLAEGSTDDGAPINASLQHGLSNLGTPLKKEIPNAYVGYTTDGEMLLKVSETDKGVKRTSVYKLNAVRKQVMSDNRFDIAIGKQSVYWDFEITNHEGSDFELDALKIWRMPLSRRK